MGVTRQSSAQGPESLPSRFSHSEPIHRRRQTDFVWKTVHGADGASRTTTSSAPIVRARRDDPSWWCRKRREKGCGEWHHYRLL